MRTMDGDHDFDVLRTERLVLRRFTAADVDSFAAYRSDPEIARYQGWEAPYTRKQAARFIDDLRDAHPGTPGAWFQIAVELTSAKTLIGDVAVRVSSDDPRLATIGFTVARAAHGHGYATEAVTAVLDYLFTTRRTHRVAAVCDVRNTASAALLERVGMRREAHHRASAWWKGEWTDELSYAILADEWAARRS